jgi:hypothetical protein
MKRPLAAIGCLFFALWACSRVIVSKHPGFNFPPTDPDSIQVHDRTAPSYPFVIIGRVSLDTTWTVKPGKDQKKIERLAAQAGADGILVTGFDIDIDAFNQHVASYGCATVSGSDLSSFAAATRPRPDYLQQTRIYGYLIKRTG